MDRIEQVREALQQLDLDAAYVRETSNIAWATAFDGVFDEERAHALLVDEHRALLHTDSRYAAACRTAAGDGPIQVDGSTSQHAAWLAQVSTQSAAQTAAQPFNQTATPHRIGIEDTTTLAEFHQLEEACAAADLPLHLVETTGVVAKLRAVKDAAEVQRLKAAQAITDAAFAHIVEFMQPGMTEIQVKVELEDYMLRHGATGLAFPSIVATGPNGANPHAQPTEARLEAGQCVVMDFGARAGGYCSDMTRMVFVGTPDAQLAHAYEVLRACNEHIEAMLAPGVTGAQAHQAALDMLEGNGFGGKMGHGLGHGVGMEVHELPLLSPRNAEPLQPGNVVTVEPGIYVQGVFGMRLEDFGVVTEGGFDVFTQSSHDMVVI